MTESPSPSDADNRKARQIREGARKAFLELGYEGASMGEIARRAGVSKGTLYNHFPDKSQLFDAVVGEETRRFSAEIMAALAPDRDLASSVRDLARRLTAKLCSPTTLALYRLCVGEGERFPHVGRALYEHGPDVCGRRLAEYLAVARSRGELDVDDVELAAHQLAALCRAQLFERMAFSMQTTATPEEIERIADAAADTFLRAYAPRR